MRTIFVNDFNLCHYPQPAYCKSNMTGVLSKSGTTYPSHATISRRLVSEIHHPGLSVTFITPACQWHPSPRLVSDIHHPGLSVTSITPACQWDLSPRLVSDIHHPGMSVTSITPACQWHPSPRLLSQIRVVHLFSFVFIILFVFVMCRLCPMLPVSLDCSFVIVLSVFSNVYLLIDCYLTSSYFLF
jgi:hypothetical protein